MKSTLKRKVLLFAKSPLLRVKTRIEAEVGREQAVEIYLELLSEVIGNVKDSGYELVIYKSGDLPEGFDFFEGLRVEEQIFGDLGVRLENALKNEIEDSVVIFIGADCPFIKNTDIRNVFERLNNQDVVIGPAEDGGYYLIGMSQALDLWSSVDWGSEKVFDQTIKIIESLKLSVSVLKSKRDIDFLEDYLYFKESK